MVISTQGETAHGASEGGEWPAADSTVGEGVSPPSMTAGGGITSPT